MTFADIDFERDFDPTSNVKVYISAGHDEYWGAKQRDRLEVCSSACVCVARYA
jgi:hypothetical protein